MGLVLGLGGVGGGCVGSDALEGGLFAEAIEGADLGAVVHVYEDDGASAADADATHPSVEGGEFVGDEGGVLRVEARELDEGLGWEVHGCCCRCRGRGHR